MSPRFGPESPPRIRRWLPALNVELELHGLSKDYNLPRAAKPFSVLRLCS